MPSFFLPAPARAVPFVLLLVATVACSRSGRTPPPGGAPPRSTGAGTSAISFDATPLYRQAGLIARGLPLPVLGRAAFLASEVPETTHVVVSVSFASAALAFAREADDRFRASYVVNLAITRGTDVMARSTAEEEVVVGTYRETTRTDETIFFQDVLDVPPGTYTLTFSLRDPASQRSVEDRLELVVPRLGEGTVASPIPIAEGVPRRDRSVMPNLLISPSGTIVVGRDSIIPVYVEAYPGADAPVRMIVSNERGRVLWSDTVAVAQRDGIRAGVVNVPASRIGIGAARLTVVLEGTTDSSSAFVFAGFGGELPVATYEEMLSYLRHFTTGERLARLREAAEEDRPRAWAEFVRATDGDPTTPEHEELRSYFARLIRANVRFREEATPGWMTDRGRVFIILGEPDHVIEPPINATQRGRQQVWEFRSLNLQLVFYDQTGAGRWRLAPQSETRFEMESRRRLR